MQEQYSFPFHRTRTPFEDELETLFALALEAGRAGLKDGAAMRYIRKRLGKATYKLGQGAFRAVYCVRTFRHVVVKIVRRDGPREFMEGWGEANADEARAHRHYPQYVAPLRYDPRSNLLIQARAFLAEKCYEIENHARRRQLLKQLDDFTQTLDREGVDIGDLHSRNYGFVDGQPFVTDANLRTSPVLRTLAKQLRARAHTARYLDAIPPIRKQSGLRKPEVLRALGPTLLVVGLLMLGAAALQKW